MIYFIRSGKEGPVKIGYTRDEQSILRRLAAIQVGNPEPITLLCFMDGEKTDEKKLHHKLKSHRVGGEWFAPSREVMYLLDMAIHEGAPEVLGPLMRDSSTGEIMVPSPEYRERYGPPMTFSVA